MYSIWEYVSEREQCAGVSISDSNTSKIAKGTQRSKHLNYHLKM